MNSEIFKKFSARAVQEARPLQASLELTNRCNERCSHCYLDSFKDDPNRVLSREDWFKILDELRVGGTMYLILMGGEPLLSPYFFDIAKRGKELGFHVSIISNGLKIKNLEYAKLLKESGVSLATFSLYSMAPEVHDKMTRVKGSHEKLMNAIKLCKQVGITVSINGLLTEANAPGIFDLYEWAVAQDFELKVDPNVTPKLSGDLEPTQYRASKETLLWFYRERAKRWPPSRPKAALETSEDYICNAAKGKCAVTAYGELLPCIEIRESFGSLVEQDFKTVWNSEAAIKWRTPKLKDMKDGDSHGLYAFCDHCPGMAKNETGEAFKLTQYSKLVAEVKRQVSLEGLNEIKNQPAL